MAKYILDTFTKALFFFCNAVFLRGVWCWYSVVGTVKLEVKAGAVRPDLVVMGILRRGGVRDGEGKDLFCFVGEEVGEIGDDALLVGMCKLGRWWVLFFFVGREVGDGIVGVGVGLEVDSSSDESDM